MPQINVEAQAAETGGVVASRRGAQQIGAVCVQPGGSAAGAGQIRHEPDVQLVIAGQVYAAQIQRHFAEDLRGRHVQQFDNGLGVLQGLQRRVDLVTVVIEFLHQNAARPRPAGRRFDPRRDPRTEKPGRKQRRKAHLRVRRFCGKPAYCR